MAFDFFPHHGPPGWKELLFEDKKHEGWELMIRPRILQRRKLNQNKINQRRLQKINRWQKNLIKRKQGKLAAEPQPLQLRSEKTQSILSTLLLY